MGKKSLEEKKLAKKNKKLALEEKSRFEMTKKHHKKTFLEAKKNGRMDSDFIPFCNYIMKTKNYFTSSTCAGRISLIGLGEEEAKKESAFYRKWHRTVTPREVIKAIKAFTGEVLYFKQEPFILHIGTNTLENARRVLVFCEKCGIKRAGIKVAKDGKFLIEMVGSQNISAPIKEGKITAPDDYIKYIVKKSNEKFEKNEQLIKKMEKVAKEILN